jgi:hypothetical protein
MLVIFSSEILKGTVKQNTMKSSAVFVLALYETVALSQRFFPSFKFEYSKYIYLSVISIHFRKERGMDIFNLNISH